MLQNKVICLDITTHLPGKTKKIGDNQVDELVQDDVDKRWLKFSKSLFESVNYNQMVNTIGNVRTKLASLSVPSPIKKGIYLIPVQLIPECEQILHNAEQMFGAAAKSFMLELDELKEKAKESLGKYYNEEDYAILASEKPSFNWKFFDLTVSSKQKLGNDLWQKEKTKLEQMWKDAEESIKEALRASFLELINNLKEKLEPTPDGKSKRFKKATIDAINEFIEKFSKRNVVNDEELEQLVDKAKQILKGVDPNVLRKDRTFADEIREALNNVAVETNDLLSSHQRTVKVV